MDPTAGMTATEKMLDSLKSVPTWLLLGACISLLSVWLWPPFYDSLPGSLKSTLPLSVFVASVLTACKIASSILTHHLENHRRSLAHDRLRFRTLYRPLTVLLLTRHVTVFTSARYPYLRDRVEHAWAELRHYRRRSVGVKRAWRAVFNRQISSSAEVEFGGDFPLRQIIDLVRNHACHADAKLLRLVSRAHRSRYEEVGGSSMTDEELALYEHIDAEESRLCARVGRQE
jgi:hypothetical protein